jgi:hypothetical protein
MPKFPCRVFPSGFPAVIFSIRTLRLWEIPSQILVPETVFLTEEFHSFHQFVQILDSTLK